MRLITVTLTGADDGTDIKELFELSKAYPFVEWGILLSAGSMGTNRYPSVDWLRELSQTHSEVPKKQAPSFAAHLCGKTTKRFMKDMRFGSPSEQWIMDHGICEAAFNRLFDRTQINFNANRDKITFEDCKEVLEGWIETVDGSLITQENHANSGLWEAFHSPKDVKRSFTFHQVLHDSSGGRGKAPAEWPRPIAGVFNGYAGGLNSENLYEELAKIEDVVGEGQIWIDMESGLRDKDDKFDLTKVEQVLKMIHEIAPGYGWF